jgi:hypothetical protein
MDSGEGIVLSGQCWATRDHRKRDETKDSRAGVAGGRLDANQPFFERCRLLLNFVYVDESRVHE